MRKNNFKLGNSINVEVIHFAPVAAGSDLFRMILELKATQPKSEAGKLIKDYEIWLTREAVEDRLELQNGATDKDIFDYALQLLEGRYGDEGNAIPSEGGLLLTNAKNIVVGNPATFPVRIPDKRPEEQLVKTTIQLPQATHKWLRQYSAEKNTGIGEVIRRVLGDFQAGTTSINIKNEQGNSSDNSGAARIEDIE